MHQNSNYEAKKPEEAKMCLDKPNPKTFKNIQILWMMCTIMLMITIQKENEKCSLFLMLWLLILTLIKKSSHN